VLVVVAVSVLSTIVLSSPTALGIDTTSNQSNPNQVDPTPAQQHGEALKTVPHASIKYVVREKQCLDVGGKCMNIDSCKQSGGMVHDDHTSFCGGSIQRKCCTTPKSALIQMASQVYASPPSVRSLWKPWPCCRLCPQNENYPDIDQVFGVIDPDADEDSVSPGSDGDTPSIKPPATAAAPGGAFIERESGIFDIITDITSRIKKKLGEFVTGGKKAESKPAGKPAAPSPKPKPSPKAKGKGKGKGKPATPKTGASNAKPLKPGVPTPNMAADNDVDRWGCCNICPSQSLPFLSSAMQKATTGSSFLETLTHTHMHGFGDRDNFRGDQFAKKYMKDSSFNFDPAGHPSKPAANIELPPCCNFCQEKYFPQNNFNDVVDIPDTVARSPEPGREEAHGAATVEVPQSFVELDSTAAHERITIQRRRHHRRASKRSHVATGMNSIEVSELADLAQEKPVGTKRHTIMGTKVTPDDSDDADAAFMVRSFAEGPDDDTLVLLEELHTTLATHGHTFHTTGQELVPDGPMNLPSDARPGASQQQQQQQQQQHSDDNNEDDDGDSDDDEDDTDLHQQNPPTSRFQQQQGIFDSIGDAWNSGVAKVKKHVSTAAAAVKHHAGRAWEATKQTVKNVASAVKTGVGKVVGHVKNAVGHVKNVAKNLWNKLTGATTPPSPKPTTADNLLSVPPPPPPPKQNPPPLKPPPPAPGCCHRCVRRSAETNFRNRFSWPYSGDGVSRDGFSQPVRN
jgi:hypothetical protein